MDSPVDTRLQTQDNSAGASTGASATSLPPQPTPDPQPGERKDFRSSRTPAAVRTVVSSANSDAPHDDDEGLNNDRNPQTDIPQNKAEDCKNHFLYGSGRDLQDSSASRAEPVSSTDQPKNHSFMMRALQNNKVRAFLIIIALVAALVLAACLMQTFAPVLLLGAVPFMAIAFANMSTAAFATVFAVSGAVTLAAVAKAVHIAGKYIHHRLFGGGAGGPAAATQHTPAVRQGVDDAYPVIQDNIDSNNNLGMGANNTGK